jgi:hypothetical protein
MVPARERSVPLTTEYRMTDAGKAQLGSLVGTIAANPGAMVQPSELRRMAGDPSIRETLARLPQGMTETDFIGVLKLALLTESATDTYAETFYDRARRYDAPWLHRFIADVWVPDERLHHTPYHQMLSSLGVGPAELNDEIAETQQRLLEYRSGDTPAHLTAYGMVQEYITDHWHGLIGRLLRPAAPAAAHLANRVKQRETLHTLWYRDMTALQVESNPSLLRHVAEAAGHFEMPGKSLVPHLEPEVPRWLPLLGADFDQMARDLTRLLYRVAGDTRAAGRLVVQIAAERGTKVGPLPPGAIRAALDRLGGPGYGLVGEALLEKVGLGYLYRDGRSRQGRKPSLRGRLRGMVRNWLAGQIEVDVAPEGTVRSHASA